MAERLDGLLQAAAPQVTRRTPQLAEVLDELVLATAAAAGQRRGRPRSRAVVVAAGLAVTVGAGVTAAAAAGVFSSPGPQGPDWFNEPGVLTLPIVLSGGQSCEVTFAAVPNESAAVPADRWQATLDAARAFVGSVDPGSFAVEEWTGQHGSDKARISAAGAELAELMQADLRGRGLPSESVTIASIHTCSLGEG